MTPRTKLEILCDNVNAYRAKQREAKEWLETERNRVVNLALEEYMNTGPNGRDLSAWSAGILNKEYPGLLEEN